MGKSKKDRERRKSVMPVAKTKLGTKWAIPIINDLWRVEGAEYTTFDVRKSLAESGTGQIPKKGGSPLATRFLACALNTTTIHYIYLDAYRILFETEVITWEEYAIKLTAFEDFQDKKKLLAVLNIMTHAVSSYRSPPECRFSHKKVTETVLRVIEWSTFGIEKRVPYVDPNDKDDDTVGILVNIIYQYGHNKFFFEVLRILRASRFYRKRVLTVQMCLRKIRNMIAPHERVLIDEVIEVYRRLRLQKDYRMHRDMLNEIGRLQRRSGIRTLTAVMMSVRCLSTIEEVADAILAFGELFSYELDVLLFDYLHAALSILQEEQEKDITRYNTVHFFFAKLPRTLKIIMKRTKLNPNRLVSAFLYFIRVFRQELDTVDSFIKDSSIELLLRELLKGETITYEQFQIINYERIEYIKAVPDLYNLLLEHENSNDKQVVVILKSSGVSLDKMSGVDKLLLVIYRMLTSSSWLFDTFVSSYTVNGNLQELTSRLALINMQSQNRKYRSKAMDSLGPPIFPYTGAFDMTFATLSRIAFNFPYLTLEQMCSTRTEDDMARDRIFNGAFYKWVKRFLVRIRPPKCPYDRPFGAEATHSEEFPIEIEMDRKIHYRSFALRLKDREVFWDPNTHTLEEILEYVPVIGDIWLDEFKDRRTDNRLKSEMANVLLSFQRLSSLMIALTQWLEGQEPSYARYHMAQCILEGMDEIHHRLDTGEREQVIWVFCRNVTRMYADDILSGGYAPHPVSITLKSIAQRTFPNCKRLQVPDTNLLKDVWHYSQRQNWFNHKTLNLIDHSNRAKQHRNWIRLFINNMMKLAAQDCMGKAVEFITAVLLMDPMRSLTVALEVLFDYLLEKREVIGPDRRRYMRPCIQHDPTFIMPLIKITVQVMLLACSVAYMNQRQFAKPEEHDDPVKKRQRVEDDDVDDDLTSFARRDPFVTGTICWEAKFLIGRVRSCVEVLMAEIKDGAGVFTPSVSVVFHVIRMIARSPRTEARHMLMRQFPTDLIHRMAHLDPRSCSVELYEEYDENPCDANKIRLLCAIYRYNGFPKNFSDITQVYTFDHEMKVPTSHRTNNDLR